MIQQLFPTAQLMNADPETVYPHLDRIFASGLRTPNADGFLAMTLDKACKAPQEGAVVKVLLHKTADQPHFDYLVSSFHNIFLSLAYPRNPSCR
jgi:hypothetical protein